MPYSNANWYNAHNFYGDLRTRSGHVDRVQSFFKTYYAPKRGTAHRRRFRSGQAANGGEIFWRDQASELPPVPDLTEPKQERKSRRPSRRAGQASRAGDCLSHAGTQHPEYYAMGLIDQILIEGDDGLEYQELVQKRSMTAAVNGGINYLGNMFNYRPMLFMADLNHDPATAPDAIVKAWDGSVSVRTKPVDGRHWTGTHQTALRSMTT
jgi:hypothetical protein